MEICDDVNIAFHKISWRKENDFYVVWKEGGSNFIELPESSFLTLKLLREGKTPKEVAEILKNKYKEYYDVKDFIQELTKLGFIHSIDGIPIPLSHDKGRRFTFIKKRHVSWIYSKPLLVFYLALILLAAVILVFNPAYFPSYADFFFAESSIVVLAVSFTVGLGLVFLHEFAHLIAGKAAGVDGYFSIGMRLYIPVAETNLTQLWKVPRKKRFVPFLAGMLNDALLSSVLIFLLWCSDLGMLDLGSVAPLFELAILLLYYGLVWQFLLFIRTDVYYALSNLLGCRNLYADSWTLVLNTFSRIFRGKNEEHQIPAKELRIVEIYAPFMLVATVLSVLFFAFRGLPIFVSIFSEGVNLFLVGLQGSLQALAEGLVLTCLIGLQIFGFLFFVIRGLFIFRSRLKSGLKKG